MKKYFNHTKKLVLLVLTVVMMIATSMVVLAADTNKAPDPTNLTNLKVGSEFSVDKYGYDTINSKKVVKSTTLYTNGDEETVDPTTLPEGASLTEYPNSIELAVLANIKIDGDKNGVTNGKIDKNDVTYKNGYFTAKSSDESVASVEIVKRDGKQYIVITGLKNGTATIKLTEQFPTNPKKPKTTSVKVTVKTLADDITFDTDVVKTGEQGEQYVEVGVKGTATLGTSTNADASNKKVKYVLLGNAKNYIKVSSKGVITGTKNTSAVEGGYVEVRVVAQDQKYKAGNKSVTWGTDEVIRVYVNNPEVKSAKILNATLTNEAAYQNTNAKKQKAQAYTALNLKTNASSNLHTYQLQVAAYGDAKWNGEEKLNAVTFTSSKPKVATVDKNGVITAVGNGSAVITVVPKDGVKLSGKEALTIKVNVTTDVENINMASTDVVALAGSSYTIKASTNSGVSVKADKTLTYTILDVDTNEAAANAAQKSAKTLSKGKITCAVEGTVSVKVASKGQPDVSRVINITFIDPVTSITAKVMNYGKTSAKATTSTTLYVDGVDANGNTVNNSTVIDTVVKTKIHGETDDLSAITATSKNPKVAIVEKEVVNGKEQFVIKAVGAGKTTVTLSATDGSKKSAKAISVTVAQKVKDITVANAGMVEDENVIYFALNENGKASSMTFKATANVAKAGLKYTFTPVANSELSGISLSKTKLTVNAAATELLQLGFKLPGAEQRVLLGTLTVEAKDAVAYTYEGSATVNHVAAKTEVKVYAVPAPTYMTVDQFNSLVDAALIANTGVAEGVTLTKGDKLDLGSDIVIPADITTRTLTWSATKADAKLVTVKNGLLTAKKVADNSVATVKATCIDAEGNVVTAERNINVRVIASQADFDKELNTQITTLLKENNYTWLGGKPTFNSKKATISVAISDITMSKEDADAEMRVKLENIIRVFKSAAQTAVWDTATEYKTVTVADTYTGNTWALVKDGSNVAVTANGEQIGVYSYADVDAAISDLSALITADIDEIVEWANKNLTVTLTAENAATGYNTHEYVTSYTVAVTIKPADVEKYLDAKVNEAVANFAAANEAVKADTGIQAITYNADTNTTTVDIYDANVAVADVYEIVKADAVAALEEIFMNASQARLQVVSPILTDEEEATCDVIYTRDANSDVNALVDELFAKVGEKMKDGSALRNLEGTTIFATVDFNFSGTIYTKEYEVTFKRTMEAIDADVDARIAAGLENINLEQFGSATYASEDNKVVVAINAFDAKLTEATGAVLAVENMVNAVAGDAFAESAELNGTSFDALYVEGSVSATEVLKAVKPAWYAETATTKVLDRTLREVVGTKATVVVYYGANETLPLSYTVEFVADMSKIEAQLDATIEASVADVNAAVVADGYAYTLELITNAEFSAETKHANVTLNGLDSEKDVLTFRDTGLCTLLENALLEAQKTGAANVTVSLVNDVENTEANPTAGTILASNEITKETVVDLFGAVLEAAEITTVGQLDGKQFTVSLQYNLGEGNEFTPIIVMYTIDFALEVPQGATAENPLFLMDQYVEPKLAPGQVVYYTGRVGGMNLTVWGTDAYILYNGETVKAVDGEAKVSIAEQASPMDPMPVVAIGNAGEEDAAFWSAFEYPLGDMMNPEYIDGYVEGSIAEGDDDGYFYTHTAAGDGKLKLWFVSATEGVNKEITITNMNTYKMYTLSEDGVEDENGDLILTIDAKAYEEFTINVASVPSVDENNNFGPIEALEYYLGMEFEYPLGSVNNPIALQFTTEELTTSVTVPASQTVYYAHRAIGGTILTIEDAEGCVVYVPGMRGMMQPVYPVDGVVTAQVAAGMPGQSVVIGIENTSEAEATYALEFGIIEGTMDNPKVVEAGEELSVDIAEGSEGYYYQWTATESGTLRVDMLSTTGWQYYVNNMTQAHYGDNHAYADSPAVAYEEIDVTAGDVILVWVSTFDPEMWWASPAGTVNIQLTFTAATASAPEVEPTTAASVEEVIVEEEAVVEETTEEVVEEVVEETTEEVVEEVVEDTAE